MAAVSPSGHRRPPRPSFYSLSSFGKLLLTEKQVLANCCAGLPTDFGTAPKGEGGKGNRLRGTFITFLLQGDDPRAPIHGAGIDINNASITGSIDFSGRSSTSALRLGNCEIEGEVVFERSTIPALGLPGSSVGLGIRAQNLQCVGDVNLVGLKIDSGGINCQNARIGGSFNASASSIPAGINFEFADIHGDFGCEKADFSGGLDGRGAKLGGSFLGDGARIVGEVEFSSISISGSVQFASETMLFGPIIFDSAKIGGSVNFTEMTGNPDIRGKLIDIGGDFMARHAQIGELNLYAASVKNNVDVSSALFSNGGLDLATAKIGGYCNLEAIELRGSLECDRITIGGSLLASGAKIGQRMNCRSACIAGSIELKNLLQIKRRIDFSFSEIGQNFECISIDFVIDKNQKLKLNLENFKVGRSPYLRAAARHDCTHRVPHSFAACR